MEYADVVWNGTCQKDLDKLDSIHITAARIVTGGTKNATLLILWRKWDGKPLQQDGEGTN